jgi:uncharacterized protein GlcG (DUF336 family)
MKRLATAFLALAGLACAPFTALAEDEALFSTRSLTPEVALKAVTAALKICRAGGYQVAVAIVDRGGLLQVMVRDRFAGAHTLDGARRKAWTSVSFRADTGEIVQALADDPGLAGIYHINDAMMVAGGRIIDAAGSLVGAIGVSGGPNGDIDDACAAAGLEAIETDIQF